MADNDQIRPGDWVTQYGSGLWRIEKLLPKYADSDYDSDAAHWKKGDLLGTWALLRKGFTPKMKFRLDFDVADARWCKPVTDDQRLAIDEWFTAHPKEAAKFRDTPFQPKPTVIPVQLTKLSEEEAAMVEDMVAALPERFTQDRLTAAFAANSLSHLLMDGPQSGGDVLFLFAHLYETDENGSLPLFGPVLKRFDA